jgi:hypothetical protein
VRQGDIDDRRVEPLHDARADNRRGGSPPDSRPAGCFRPSLLRPSARRAGT